MSDLRISIIIPAYNEERHLAACLDSIAAQSAKPYEVIVVDNNSTDQTAKVASKYGFVTVLREPKQGLIPARDVGFSGATGDVFGRINADVVLDKNWVERLQNRFADKSLAGLSGPAYTKPLPSVEWGYTTFWSKLYFWDAEAYFGVSTLWGANMAIRASVWNDIQKLTNAEDSRVHEDQDISLCIAEIGGRIEFDSKLLLRTGEQSYFYWPKLHEYLTRARQTKLIHKKRQSVHAYPTPPVRRALLALFLLPFSLLFLIASLVAYLPTRLFRALHR